MKCTNCGKNAATFHYKSNVNGSITEVHLCPDCANHLGYTAAAPATEDYFSSMLHGFFDPSPLLHTEKSCPLCGATVSDIRRTGKVGCANCYEVFSELLDPYIRRIHGTAHHSGKLPKAIESKNRAKHELARLKKELDEAVKKQDFEQAAVLRDRINDMKEADSNE